MPSIVIFLFFSLFVACGGSSGSKGSSVIPSAQSSAINSSSLSTSSSSTSLSSQSASSSASNTDSAKIEMRVNTAADYIYVTVNGIRRRVGYWGQQENLGVWQDITSWFKQGDNDVLVQAMNDGGAGYIGFDLRVGGNNVLSASCYAGSCGGAKGLGIFYESRLVINAPTLPKSGSLRVSGMQNGQIYINDEYVGASPKTFELAPGSYKIGYGVSNDNIQDMNDDYYENFLALGKQPGFLLTGSFYETHVDLSAGESTSVAPDVISAPLPPQNKVKIALLPFKKVMSKEMKTPLVLTQEVVDGFAQQIMASSHLLALPTMYGLSEWEVTVLPMDETLNVNAASNAGIVDALYNTQNMQEYKSIYDNFDVVVLFQSSYHEDGSIEPIFAGGMTAGGRVIHVTSGWTWTLPSNALNRGFYHEMYHHYEFWEAGLHHYYHGLGGLHAQREHGFTGSGDSVQHYYRLYARGQVGEDPKVNIGVDWPTPLLGGAPNPVGVFHAVRYGKPSTPTQ